MIRYLVAVFSFELALFIHIILYNLHLSDLGLREDSMGRLGAVMVAGMIAGALPAGWLARRWGLKPVILAAIIGLSLSLAARAVVVSFPALVLSSVLVGLAISTYNVTNPPALAALAPQAQRGKAFSGSMAIAVGSGALGGLLAGWLPTLLHSKQAALLVAAVVPLAGLISVAGLRLPPAPQVEAARRPVDRKFLMRFVGGVALWYAFTAGVGPFFNIYLSRVHHASTPVIGNTYAISQVLQALAALSMAWWIARLGLVRSVLLSQVLASLAVLGFLGVHSVAAAGGVYMVHMSLLIMAEPALMNFLMDRVGEDQRATASAINEMLNLGAHVIVVAAAGSLITCSGYGALFAALCVLGLVSAAVFYAVLGRGAAAIMSP